MDMLVANDRKNILDSGKIRIYFVEFLLKTARDRSGHETFVSRIIL